MCPSSISKVSLTTFLSPFKLSAAFLSPLNLRLRKNKQNAIAAIASDPRIEPATAPPSAADETHFCCILHSEVLAAELVSVAELVAVGEVIEPVRAA
jgi:hypothetical protein